ncbi:MAG: 50S ribosomal protein L13 [Candidatus Diapherotrites archaeon]
MTIIDATNCVLGRLASIVAKRALKGEEIILINAEKAVIVGNERKIVEKFGKWLKMAPKGNPKKGPKFSRMPDRLVRRTIRGMLPWKQPKGKMAFRKIKVYMKKPSNIKDSEIEVIESVLNKQKKIISVAELSRKLGAKW